MPYLTGAPSNSYIMRLIRIPSDTSFLIAVNGALLELASATNWETFGTMTAQEASEAAFVMWGEYMNSSLVGQVFAHMLQTAPEGALNCEGQTVPRALYPRLYDAVAPVFRVGPDHIKLPDLRGRMVRGASLGDLGLIGGSETVTLTEAEMPPHTHTALPHTHATTIPVATVVNGGVEAPAASATPVAGVTAAADVVINSSGGGQPHDNMPPYLCLTWAVWAE